MTMLAPSSCIVRVHPEVTSIRWTSMNVALSVLAAASHAAFVLGSVSLAWHSRAPRLKHTGNKPSYGPCDDMWVSEFQNIPRAPSSGSVYRVHPAVASFRLTALKLAPNLIAASTQAALEVGATSPAGHSD